jgi:hypothetical protein
MSISGIFNTRNPFRGKNRVSYYFSLKINHLTKEILEKSGQLYITYTDDQVDLKSTNKTAPDSSHSSWTEANSLSRHSSNSIISTRAKEMDWNMSPRISHQFPRKTAKKTVQAQTGNGMQNVNAVLKSKSNMNFRMVLEGTQW